MQKFVVVDVGANAGELGKYLLNENEDLFVISIEPNKEFCEHSLLELKKKYLFCLKLEKILFIFIIL
jgi:hypothetical protein